MSARTMQRRLEELGTTYQGVLDDVRRVCARRLLADTDLGTGEVAFLLGFGEVNSFTRAFHAWEGTTPARWRMSRFSKIGLSRSAVPLEAAATMTRPRSSTRTTRNR